MPDERQSAPPPSVGRPSARDQRSVRNYLIDRRFQLKYTAMLVAIAALLSGALGFVLWKTSGEVIAQSRAAVAQGKLTVQKGQETVKRGQQVIELSQNLSNAVRMDVERQGNPDLLKTFEEDTADEESKRKEEQKRLEQEALQLKSWAAELEKQAAAVEEKQRSIALGLLFVLSLLVIGVGLAGIVFTHKVAGPIHKMKRLLRQIGGGRLVMHERLRRGDELHDFFATFETMVSDLRKRKEGEVVVLGDALSKLESDSPDAKADGLALLQKLRAEMKSHVES